MLVTLGANISLPASPTPQRVDDHPDDASPLVELYRNVTLAGGVRPLAAGATELDVRQRRNAFDLALGAARRGLPQPVLVMVDLQVGAPCVARVAGCCEMPFAGLGLQRHTIARHQPRPASPAVHPPTLTRKALACALGSKQPAPHLRTHPQILNAPSGPPSTWPLGLLSLQHSYLGADRCGR